MSGYKRVNYYELCRLCASNQEKEKTHIFQDEGRKLQLQLKIQLCLTLEICEHDPLPKVVCSQCIHELETCYAFRQACKTSETMLSSYFTNFRYTDDFKKAGKVYIKDTVKHDAGQCEASATTQGPPQGPSVYAPQMPQAVTHSSLVQQHHNVGRTSYDQSTIVPIKKKDPLPHTAQQCDVTSLNLYLKPSKAPDDASDSADVSNPTYVDASEQRAKPYKCDDCDKVFRRREHLYQHSKLHTGQRPFSCGHCHKTFMRKEHLLRHLTSHSGAKNFTCDVCSKSFSRNDNLNKHRKTHDRQGTFTCEVCQKQFVMKHYYLQHRVAHSEPHSGAAAVSSVSAAAAATASTILGSLLVK